MIVCENIKVSYGKKTVIHDAGFTAENGKITVILGKNGSGKTTLLRAISGGSRYTGSIRIDGQENRSLSERERAKRLSIMPQLMHSPRITVREFIRFGRQPYTGITGILSQKDMDIAEEVIRRTGLSDLAERNMNCISGGERQKAYFAMLLTQDTPNLLLDEPSSHMDPAYTKNLMSFLQEEKENGKTVVSVLHDLNAALDISDQVVLLHAGRIAFSGTRDAFYESTCAEEIFGVKKYLCKTPDGAGEKIVYL